MTAELWKLTFTEFWATIYMTLASAGASYVIGLPLGLLLCVTAEDGIKPNRGINAFVGGVVNILRSVPFLILLITVIPVTRFICGTAIGSVPAIVPLTIAAFPFVARMVESSAKEVDQGVIEASLSMGASASQVVWRVIVPEAAPSLINGAAIAATTILGYSAMAGICGGGGLGSIAINYGYYRSQTDIMLVMVVILIAIVAAFQSIGAGASRRIDRRIRQKKH